jgi:hypothetical protein
MKKTAKQAYVALLLGLATATAAADEAPVGNETKAPGAAPAQSSAPAATPSSRVNWSWVPVKEPAIPEVAQKDWVRTPIDAFILTKLEAKGLKPSPEADRNVFIRRATLDAWGLIPSPEDVAAFVNDKSPEAYEKLVDRLLASPHYGERQARRWLDLARYADSAGFQNDQTRPNLWRYRDYVINSFNEDKPFSRFIQEQIAGDELAPDNQNILVATDFLLGYPDNANSRDLVDRKYQITTDITDTVGQAILGTTVGCARCHNHKTDKFSQADYYSLQAFFANTSEDVKIPAKKGDVEREYEKQQAKWEAATKDIRGRQAELLEPLREAALKYHKERYLTDSRVSIFKPEAEWTAHDRWINHRLVNVTTEIDYAQYLQIAAEDKDFPTHSEEYAKRWQEYKKLTEELKKFDKLKPAKGSDTITAATELGHPDAPPTYIYFGGNHERPLDEVQPAFPAGITSEKPDIVPTATSSGRRTALAKWLVSDENPLTARVYVNRVWNEYFAKGIVATVSDFGKAGDKPTNQELLDYLASDFVKNGWDVKKLHREILLSNVYREASDYREDVHKADPENKLLAVFPRKRLDAEEIRDSILVASGKLEEEIGGPSVFPPVPNNLNAGPAWEVSKDPHDYNRRSLYIFVRRSVPYPLLETFDMAQAQLTHAKRDVTTTPLQALTLYNSEIVFGWSQALAGRIIREVGNDESAQIERLYQILFSRNPDETEKATLLSFVLSHEKTIRDKAQDGKLSLAIPIGLNNSQSYNPVRESVFVDLVHTVLNSNDFSYRF